MLHDAHDQSPVTPAADAVNGYGAEHALRQLSTIARELDSVRLAVEAESIADRVGAGQFYVACVGQFKRGKSTLLDALIGDAVLPTGIVPVTAVPTVVRYGRQRTARVRLVSGRWQHVDPDCLTEWVSEEHNPENARGVTGVEVFVNAPLLAGGMCLVDTPGLGSVFEGNAELTREFVPNIDAALVVIGADPPLTGDELSLIEDVARHVTALLFVLNKSDRVSETERQTAIAFARSVLERRLRRPITRIYEISAAERLSGGTATRDWESLENSLADLARQSRFDLVRAAGERAVVRIADQLLASIQAQRAALVAPTEETERLVATLDVVVRDAERSMIELGYLLFAEQQRLSRRFEADREEFLARITPLAHSDLTRALVGMSSRWGPGLRREMLARTQEIARMHVTPWLAEQQANAEDAYRRASARFIELGNTFLARLASTGGPPLTHLGKSLDRDQGFRVRSSFYFNDLIHIAQPASPFRLILDMLLGLLGIRRPFERAAHRFLDRLLVMNATRVQSDVEDRVVESRRALEGDIRGVLVEVRTGATRALENARAARITGADAVRDAIARLDLLERQVRQQNALVSAPGNQ